MTIAEVIARLERATEGSRELDYAIWDALYPPKIGGGEDLPRDFGFVRGQPLTDCYAPEYTCSLDAAVSLVPEGWFWRCGRTSHNAGWAYVSKCFDPLPHEEAAFFRPTDTTPALALCIAALRARLAKEGA